MTVEGATNMPDVSNEGDHTPNSNVSSAPSCQCQTCRGAGGTQNPPQFVYAVGQIVPRFPSISVEREFQLIASHAKTEGHPDSQVFNDIVLAPENRYLSRKLCWVFRVSGLETFILVSRDAQDLQLLLGTLSNDHDSPKDDVLIGRKLGVAPEGFCGALRLPMVVIDQIYSFQRKDFLNAIGLERAGKHGDGGEGPTPAVAEVFARILQSTDNAGLSPGDRALNFLAIRYPALYHTVATRFDSNFSLAEISTRKSEVGSPREIVDVIFTFRHRQTGFFERVSTRVDVTEEFPFVVTQVTPYIEH
jgi:PatG C-terminal